MTRKAAHALAALVAVAGIAWLAWPSDAPQGDDAPGEAVTPAVDEPPQAELRTAEAAPGPQPASSAEAEAADGTPLPETALLEAARLEAAHDAAGDEAARDDALEALRRERTKLIEQLRLDPAAAQQMLDRLLAAPETEALALARVLRHVPDAALGRRLVGVLTTASEPHLRHAAVMALEGRDHALWLQPVSKAFHEDTAPEVQESASRLLSYALRDRRVTPKHAEVRQTLLAGTEASDPQQRARAAAAFAIDREAPPEVRERLAEMARSDPDAAARAAASSALRALGR